MPVVDLTVDRNLICANFDGYKLSFEPVPVLRQGFEHAPLKQEPHVNQFSLLHVEIFAMHNLLFADPWERTNSYYINTKHEVILCSYDAQNRGQPNQQRVVFSVQQEDHGDGSEHRMGDYNYSLNFISEKYCVLCDGCTTLYLLDTGDRTRATRWQLQARAPVNKDLNARGFLLYDARLDIVQERKQISVVCGHVGRREAANSEDMHIYIMQLTWARWTQPQSNVGWSYNMCEYLETTGSIYYCAFEPRAESLVICSNREVMTENQRIAAAVAAEVVAETEQQRAQLHNGDIPLEQPPDYSWTQTESDVSLRFVMPPGASRNDFNIRCSSCQVHVKYLQRTLLDGKLYADVDNDLTTWTVDHDCLHMTLMKQNQLDWPQLLEGDGAPPELNGNDPMQNRGEGSPTDRLPIPNLEEPIEDCDFPLGTLSDDIKMVRYNLPARAITHTIFVGPTPPLFSTSLRAGFPAAFATRQGVDACVWLQVYQPAKPNEWSVRHEANLHAFGYVQASKEQRKFIDCSPDLEYAVICESYRHLFIYKPRYDTADGLRKRSGPQVVIGKQNLVSLDDDVGEVLGLTTAANVITVLTERAIFYLQV